MSEAPAMKITILTIFPEMFESVLNSSILGRARAQGILDIRCVDIRPFSDRKHKNTDDYPFGGGAGMVAEASGSNTHPFFPLHSCQYIQQKHHQKRFMKH